MTDSEEGSEPILLGRNEASEAIIRIAMVGYVDQALHNQSERTYQSPILEGLTLPVKTAAKSMLVGVEVAILLLCRHDVIPTSVREI